MIWLCELPVGPVIDAETAGRIFREAGFENQEVIPEYAWKAVKLAYELGFCRSSNLHFI